VSGQDETYHVSIIDYLQKYTVGKSIERIAKALANGANFDIISSAPPDRYAYRFKRFIETELLNL
jgi:hypothetical protein